MRSIVLVVLLVAGPLAATAQRRVPFCAATLSVTYSGGAPVSSAVAELLDSTGKVEQTASVKGGYAEFCDFEFGRHSIRVSINQGSCGATVIEDVRISYGHTLKLEAVLNRCSYYGDGLATGCLTFLKVRSTDGKGLAGVQILQNGVLQPDRTDLYGRGLLGLAPGTEGDFRFEKEGFQPTQVRLACPDAYHGVPEKTVVLTPELKK